MMNYLFVNIIHLSFIKLQQTY